MCAYRHLWASEEARVVKYLTTQEMQETQVQPVDREDPLE